MTSERQSTTERLPVAVIAVHGVADQERGATGDAVSALLASAIDGAAVRREERLLNVPHLQPMEARASWPERNGGERLLKSISQSCRSDFMTEVGDDEDAAAPDLGVRLTDYLLHKAQTRPRHRETAKVAVSKVSAATLEAEVYEMFWADLSRVRSGFVQIFSELVTLLFRFARLSTEAQTLAALRSDSRPLKLLSGVQRAAEWLFSRVLGPGACQLLVCVLWVVGARAVSSLDNAKTLSVGLGATCAVLAAASACGLVYFRRLRWLPSLAIATCFGALAWWLTEAVGQPRTFIMLMWFAAVTAAYFGMASFWDQRFRLTFVTGTLTYVATSFCFFWFALGPMAGAEPRWTWAAVRAAECTLVGNLYAWMFEGALLALTVPLFELTLFTPDGRRARVRKSMVTGRLGLFTSVGAFIIALMVGCSVVCHLLSDWIGKVPYAPLYFRVASATPLDKATVADFLTSRVAHSGASFAPIALLLLALVGFVVVAFAPSVAREVRLVDSNDPARLGGWLTSSYHAIERMVRIWGWPSGITALLVVFLLILHQPENSGHAPRSGPLWDRLLEFQRWWVVVSSVWLSSIVKAVAASGVGLLALSKLAIRQLKALRAPLDAALDVDNHFREFPRTAISRVRIFERYLALLEHVQNAGCQHLVIVAHSQGTVITADLLRYLRQRQFLLPNEADRAAKVGAWLASIDVSLLSVGSPLRQLYALRFPNMYAWALDRNHAPMAQQGPAPSDLSLRRWWNLWASGDYVGRWLWTHEAESGPFALDVDAVRYGAVVRAGHDARGASWQDQCIGADAHTHYFDLDAPLVASRLLELVTSSSDLGDPDEPPGSQPESDQPPAPLPAMPSATLTV